MAPINFSIESAGNTFLALAVPVPEAFVCPLPHTLWPRRKRRQDVGIAAEALLDPTDPAKGVVVGILPFARDIWGFLIGTPQPPAHRNFRLVPRS